MKKLILALVIICLVPITAYGATVDTRVSANTVSYNTVNFAVNRGPHIVTFNTVTKFIRLVNLSSTTDCYADIRCVDSGGKPGYATNATMNILLPAIGRVTPSAVEFNFATKNLAFRVDSVSTTAVNEGGNNCRVHYVVTGDWGDF